MKTYINIRVALIQRIISQTYTTKMQLHLIFVRDYKNIERVNTKTNPDIIFFILQCFFTYNVFLFEI